MTVRWVLYTFCFYFLINLSVVMNAAIAQGTLVSTPLGFVAVEDLHPGDRVKSIDAKELVITNITICTVDTVICVVTDKTNLCLSKDHRLYDPVLAKWVPVKSFIAGSALLDRKAHCCLVQSVNSINSPCLVYEISLEAPHQFYVSDAELLTHNFVPIAVGISFAIGSGISISGIGMGIGALGLGLWHKIKGSKKVELAQFDMGQQMRQQRNAQNKNAEQSAAGGPPEDPKKDDKDKKKRKINEVSKSEFFKSVKNRYEHWRNGIYKLKKGKDPIEGAEYMEWDHLHDEVEIYNAGRKHLGAINPKTYVLMKDPVLGRTIPK